MAADVFFVQFDLSFEGDVASPGNLPCASDPGEHVKAFPFFQRVVRDFIRGGRTGPDQTHISDDDVEKLRQLINAEFTDEASDSCDARVFFHFENDSILGFVLGHELFFDLIRIGIHGPEFVKEKVAAVFSHTDLPVDHAASGFQTDCDSENQEEGE